VRASASKAGMKHPPEIMTVFHMCKLFHWTINQFYDQPKRDLEMFSIIQSEIDKINAEEQARADAPRRR